MRKGVGHILGNVILWDDTCDRGSFPRPWTSRAICTSHSCSWVPPKRTRTNQSLRTQIPGAYRMGTLRLAKRPAVPPIIFKIFGLLWDLDGGGNFSKQAARFNVSGDPVLSGLLGLRPEEMSDAYWGTSRHSRPPATAASLIQSGIPERTMSVPSRPVPSLGGGAQCVIPMPWHGTYGNVGLVNARPHISP
jgi:hypothetical protein